MVESVSSGPTLILAFLGLTLTLRCILMVSVMVSQGSPSTPPPNISITSGRLSPSCTITFSLKPPSPMIWEMVPE